MSTAADLSVTRGSAAVGRTAAKTVTAATVMKHGTVTPAINVWIMRTISVKTAAIVWMNAATVTTSVITAVKRAMLSVRGAMKNAKSVLLMKSAPTAVNTARTVQSLSLAGAIPVNWGAAVLSSVKPVARAAITVPISVRTADCAWMKTAVNVMTGVRAAVRRPIISAKAAMNYAVNVHRAKCAGNAENTVLIVSITSVIPAASENAVYLSAKAVKEPAKTVKQSALAAEKNVLNVHPMKCALVVRSVQDAQETSSAVTAVIVMHVQNCATAVKDAATVPPFVRGVEKPVQTASQHHYVSLAA